MSSPTRLVGEWTGSTVFLSSSQIDPPVTPKRGTASSPISIHSSPEISDLASDAENQSPSSVRRRAHSARTHAEMPISTLGRPRAVPRYASTLPRTAFTPPRAQTLAFGHTAIPGPTARPIHPFFSRKTTQDDTRSKSAPITQSKSSSSSQVTPAPFVPKASQPRLVATYSSTSASEYHSDSSVGFSNSQDSVARSSQASQDSQRSEDGSGHEDREVTPGITGATRDTDVTAMEEVVSDLGMLVVSTPTDSKDTDDYESERRGIRRAGLTRIVPKRAYTGPVAMGTGPMTFKVREVHTDALSVKPESASGREEEVDPLEDGRDELSTQGDVGVTDLASEASIAPQPTSASNTTTYPPLDPTSHPNPVACPIPPVLSFPTFSHSIPLPPHFTRPPQIVYTSVPEEASELLSCLRGPVLGFDMEWPRPGGFQTTIVGGKKVTKAVGGVWDKQMGRWKFPERKTALIQVCDESMVILYHLRNTSTLPPAFVDLVTDPTRYKAGVQVRGDGQKLVRDFPTQFTPDKPPTALLELTQVARAVDPENAGTGHRLLALAKLARMYLSRELDKDSTIRQGEWDQTLGPEQVHYASNDVFASLLIYQHLDRLSQTLDRPISLDACCLPVDGGATPLADLLVSSGTGTGTGVSARSGALPSDIKITPAQSRALAMFISGQNVPDLVQDLGIKESTVLSYLLQAVQAVTVERIPLDARKRLYAQVPTSSIVAKKFRELLKRLSEIPFPSLSPPIPSSPSPSLEHQPQKPDPTPLQEQKQDLKGSNDSQS